VRSTSPDSRREAQAPHVPVLHRLGTSTPAARAPCGDSNDNHDSSSSTKGLSWAHIFFWRGGYYILVLTLVHGRGREGTGGLSTVDPEGHLTGAVGGAVTAGVEEHVD
jgi:hypothetical protein